MGRKRTEQEAFNDIHYAATIIEYISRATKNRPADTVKSIGLDGISKLYEFADVNHCLPFEQVSDETVEQYHIPQGNFTAAEDKSPITVVPSATAIGKSYARLIKAIEPNTEHYPQRLFEILSSKFSDWMSNYRSSFCCSFTDYLLEEYRELSKAI